MEPFSLTVLLAATTVGQCPSYSVQSVSGQVCGVLGPESAAAWGMSSSGHILCGETTTCDLVPEHFAFMWEPGGAVIPMPFPVPTTYSRAHDVNQQGTVVGEVDAIGEAGRRGFKSQDGKTVFLQPPAGGLMTSAQAVNSSGLAVGSSVGDGAHAVYWVGTEGVSLQSQLPIGPSSRALGVNDRGQICGWMGGGGPFPRFALLPFIWDNGKTTILPLPPYAAANTGVATALNSLGDACGYFFIEGAKPGEYLRRACAWIDGKFIDVGLLPGADISHALDINDAREIVGYCEGPGLAADVGFLWRDGVMMSLADLVPAGTLVPRIARAINNFGQIAGRALLPPDNDGVAFRLTPALPLTPGDTNCSASVDVDDLVNVILDWNPPGPVGGNPTDVNRDNRIDIEDLIEVIRRWSSPR